MDLPPFPFWIDQKYEATRLLGKGGGGYALLAKKGNQTFAIKLLNLTLVRDPGKAIQKFKKEFLTLKKLNHPHIGKLFDFGYDNQLNQYYFAGEYIDGRDIRKACEKLSMEEMENLLVQSLQALHYLHTYARAGLRHNDIKTANILVTQKPGEEAQLKLIDFGLASLKPLDVKGGTASYMSPEQISLTFPDLNPGEKFPKPDHRTDLYSLGVVWYFCLTHVNPFLVDRDTQATLKRHFGPLSLPPSTLRPEIPAHLDTIILKLLKQNPLGRYESAAEAIEELKFLSGKPYSAVPATLSQYTLPQGEWIGQPQVWKPLKEKWDKLFEGDKPQPSLIHIFGEPGQGKTKILEHFKNYVQSHEGKFLFLKQDSDEDVAEWLSELRRWTQENQHPLVIAVDNFSSSHPAQRHLEALWEKIRFAQKWEAAKPIRWLFVLTTNDAKSAKADAGLESVTLFLKNFETPELAELVKKLIPDKNSLPPEAFIQKLKNHTGGNPLFVTAVLKAMMEKGLPFNDETLWRQKLSAPKDLEAALQANWKNFSAPQKNILKWLACFPSGVTREDLLALDKKLKPFDLEKLCADETVVADPKNRLTFKNSFLQHIVLKPLTKKEKGALHEKIAAFLKKRKRPSHRIAYHQAQSPKPSVKLSALEELAQFYEQSNRLEEALEARREELKMTKSPLPAVLPLLSLMERLRMWEEGEKTADRWLKQIPKNKNGDGWRAALLRAKGMLWLKQNRPSEARECFEKALSLLEGDKKHLKERVILKNTIARTYLSEGKLDLATPLYKETRAALEDLNSDEASEVTNNDLGYCYLLSQNTKALSCFENDLRSYEKARDKIRLLRGHFLMASALRRLNKDFNAAIVHYQKSLELAKDTRDNDWMMRIYNGLAATYLDRAHSGDQTNAYPQALRYFGESLALCQTVQKESHELDCEMASIYLNMGTVYRETANFSKALDNFKIILTVLEAKPDKDQQEWVCLCETYIALADCLAAQKKYPEMENPIKKAWKITKDLKSMSEHQLAIQLLWAEYSDAMENAVKFNEHLKMVESLQVKYKIQPTPTARKKLEELKRKMTQTLP